VEGSRRRRHDHQLFAEAEALAQQTRDPDVVDTHRRTVLRLVPQAPHQVDRGGVHTPQAELRVDLERVFLFRNVPFAYFRPERLRLVPPIKGANDRERSVEVRRGQPGPVGHRFAHDSQVDEEVVVAGRVEVVVGEVVGRPAHPRQCFESNVPGRNEKDLRRGTNLRGAGKEDLRGSLHPQCSCNG